VRRVVADRDVDADRVGAREERLGALEEHRHADRVVGLLPGAVVEEDALAVGRADLDVVGRVRTADAVGTAQVEEGVVGERGRGEQGGGAGERTPGDEALAAALAVVGLRGHQVPSRGRPCVEGL
jgi:hypothetical protein